MQKGTPMTTPASITETAQVPPGEPRKRGYLFYVRRGLKWFGIVLVTLVLLGVVYQTVATELDKRAFAPRGQFYTVNGHSIHMVCQGDGSPAVILLAGGGAESLWWYRVQNELATDTRVCAYDRPGHGWSESTSEPRDALTIVRELHTLLEVAGVSAPHVVVGHSFGAAWARIYAVQYPDEVSGIVLVDSTLFPGEYASESEFASAKSSNDALQAIVWALYRTGLVRLTAAGDFQKTGFPADVVPELAALRSPNHVFDADYAEQVGELWAFRVAAATSENLGDRPLAVLWASDTNKMMELLPNLRDLHAKVSTYSTNSTTHIVEDTDHLSILGNEAAAQQVSNAVREVMHASELER